MGTPAGRGGNGRAAGNGAVRATLLLLAVAYLGATTAEARRTARAPAPTADWTVLVYLNANNSLEPFAVPNFRQMAAADNTDTDPSPSRVHLIVQMARWRSDDLGDETWGGMARFRVTHGLEATTKNALEYNKNNVDMGSPSTLADFLRWGKAAFPASRYMVVIWNHGAGWRSELRARLAERARAPRTLRAAGPALLLMQGEEAKPRSPDSGAAAADLVYSNPVKSVSFDELSGHFLYNRDMEETIRAVFAGGAGRLEVMGFDACLMSMAETAYAMRDVAKVLVGSEDLEPGTGWEYRAWVDALAKNSNMDGKALGGRVVDAYRAYYSGAPSEAATLSAIDCERTRPLADAVTVLGNALTSAVGGADLAAVTRCRADCGTYARDRGYNNVDLRRLCDQVESRFPAGSVQAMKASAARQAVDSAVVANWASVNRRGAYGSGGIAIYYPEGAYRYSQDQDHDAYRNDITVDHAVEFVQDTRWPNYLQTYFQKVP